MNKQNNVGMHEAVVLKSFLRSITLINILNVLKILRNYQDLKPDILAV